MRRTKLGSWNEIVCSALLRSGLTGVGCIAGLCGILLAIAVVLGMLSFGIFAVQSNGRLPMGPVSAQEKAIDLVVIGTCVVAFGILSGVLIHGGRAILDAAESVPVVLPKTAVNIADLPAQESLLRGSDRPAVDDGDVLMRPAGVLRASGSHELLHPAVTDAPE